MPKLQSMPSGHVSDASWSRWSTMIELEGPLICLSGNLSCSHLVVGGRSVFKVFDIRDPVFSEAINLRYGATASNLTYSAYDVSWSHLDDSLVTSAAPNGAIAIWDMNRIQNPKLEYVFTENKRIVNRVVFHPSDVSLLLSGSQDGSVKLFDIRTKEYKLNFSGTVDSSVRDVQFEPHSPHLFAAGSDNGAVQIWDLRYPNRTEATLQAHSGPCFTLDWHPEERWLATGGRDRTVKVWDFTTLSSFRSPCVYTAHTISSIARAKWRPHYKYEIATSASLVEFGINIWDVRRPYLPSIYYSRHQDVVTGIMWKTNDSEIFYSTSKDNSLCRHHYNEGQRLEDNANPVTVNFSIHGSIVSAVSNKILTDMSSKVAAPSQSRLPSVFRKIIPEKAEEDEAFAGYKSVLTEFTSEHEFFSMDYFVRMAKNYRLNGATLSDLCDHNLSVAQNVKKSQVATVWRMLKIMFNEDDLLLAAASGDDKFENLSDDNNLSTVVNQGITSNQTTAATSGRPSHIAPVQQSTSVGKKITEASTGVSDDESDGPDITFNASHHYANIFGDDENRNLYDEFLDFDESCRDERNLVLPSEAVVVTDPLDDQFGTNILMGLSNDPWSANNSAHDDSESSSTMTTTTTHRVDVEEAIKQEILNIVPFQKTIPPFDYKPIICDQLSFFADQNDVQTAVSMIIVLGDRIRSHIRPDVLEQWFTSYIDLLGQFELWSVATEVIKLSEIMAVSILTRMSTEVRVNCGRCHKNLPKNSWICERCDNRLQRCIICHLPVKGLYIWCQGCAHGGHVHHLTAWFADHKECPTGCGHLCEYV